MEINIVIQHNQFLLPSIDFTNTLVTQGDIILKLEIMPERERSKLTEKQYLMISN